MLLYTFKSVSPGVQFLLQCCCLHLSQILSSEYRYSIMNVCLCTLNTQPTDQGMYSCHLHHHYCGLHERREFQVTVEAPVIQTTLPAKALPSEDKGNTHSPCSHKYTNTYPNPHTQTHTISLLGSSYGEHKCLSREDVLWISGFKLSCVQLI